MSWWRVCARATWAGGSRFPAATRSRLAAGGFNEYNQGLRATVLDVSSFAERVASGSTQLAASSRKWAAPSRRSPGWAKR